MFSATGSGLPSNLFTYENISQHKSVVFTETNPRFISMQLGSFIQFGYIGDDAPLQRGEVGWKIHIAVNDDDIGRAWDVVKNILIDECIAQTKIVRQGVIFSDGEAGKQVTIYQFVNSDKDWNSILLRIEMGLRREHISTGEFCLCDRQIPGSLYLSYRNDSNEEGTRYISQKTALRIAGITGGNAYNLYSREDQLINIDFSYIATETPAGPSV